MDRIRNELIRGTDHVKCLGEKVREQIEVVCICLEERL